MRTTIFCTTVCATALALVSADEARSAVLHYTVEVSPVDRRVLDVDVRLTGHRGDGVTFVLATPAIDAERYFTFFDDVRAWDADSLELPADRVAPGIYRVSGARLEVGLHYRVHVADLNVVAGGGHQLPLVDEAGAVLPLRSILAVPEGGEEIELPIDGVTIGVIDGMRPVHVPWASRDGRGSFSGPAARDIVRTGIAVTGSAIVVDGRERDSRVYLVARGAGALDAEDAFTRLGRLAEHYAAAFGRPGDSPLSVVLEVAEGAHDVAGSGRFLRARCPAGYLHATPAELEHGGDAYSFYVSLAHEIYHGWIGVHGLARPAGPEVFWLSEGAAEYGAWIALVRTELARAETVLDALASAARTLREHPDRSRPLDGDAAVHRSSASFRKLLMLKAPLVCFLLDSRLLEHESPATGAPWSLDALTTRLLVGTERHDASRASVFRAADIRDALESMLGEAAQAILTTYLTGTLDAALVARARAVGIGWTERAGTPELTLEPGSPFARRLGVE